MALSQGSTDTLIFVPLEMRNCTAKKETEEREGKGLVSLSQ